jgi:hypothetical protein
VLRDTCGLIEPRAHLRALRSQLPGRGKRDTINREFHLDSTARENAGYSLASFLLPVAQLVPP